MLRACWALGLCGLLMGCGEAQTPGQTQASLAAQTQFLDASLPAEARLSGAQVLSGTASGRAFLTAQYWTPRRPLVQALLDSLVQREPEQAARLLAGLMAAAGGESKLHFESQLVKLGDPAVTALVALAESNSDWQTAMRALDALGKLKAPQGVEVMRANLSHPNDWVRLAAAHALGEVGDSEAVSALMTTLGDTSDTVVAAALIGLGKAGAPRAFNACAKRLHHANPRVRGAAVSALGRLGGANARDLLVPMLDDPDSGVRFKAKAALEQLDQNEK